MATTLKHINVSEIHEPDEALRKVDREQESYQGLVESIRSRGVMNPITVREIQSEGGVLYGLVDGLQRLTASKDAGCDTVPCHVIEVEDAELIEAQIIANVHKIETKPVEYSKALLLVLSRNPLLTRTELADRLAKTPTWLSERLGLLKLAEDVGSLVDEGKIPLSNAYALAKLASVAPDEQNDFIDRALTMPPAQFAPTINARIKEIRDSKRKGKDVGPSEFVPIAMLRSRTELVQEAEAAKAGPALCKEFNTTTGPDGFALGVKWALNLDPISVEIQKAKDEERKLNRERAKEKAKAERQKKKAEEAAAKAEALKAEAEATAGNL